MEIIIGFGSALAVALLVPTYVDRKHATTGNEWYRTKIRPAVHLAPPTWVFPVVWTLLYLAICAAIGYWAAIQPSISYRSATFISTWVLFCANLLFNRLWTLIFFSYRDKSWSLSLAAFDAFLIFATAVTVVVLFHISPATNAWIFGLWYPYVAWTFFALVLTIDIRRKLPQITTVDSRDWRYLNEMALAQQ